MDLWLASIALFAIASAMSAVNTLTTILKLRGEGMTWERLPAHRLGMVHRRAAQHPRVLRLARSIATTLLRSPPANRLLSPRIRRHQRRPAPTHRRRQPSALAPLSSVLRPPRGLHRHPARYGTHLHGARQLRAPPRLCLSPDDRNDTPHRLPRHPRLGHHMFVAGLNPFTGSAFAISTMASRCPHPQR